MGDKDNRGGKRIGAGPKPKYNEETVNVTFRVPVSKKQDFKGKAKIILDEYKKSLHLE